MFKKIWSSIIFLALLSTISTFAADITVYIDGQFVEFDAQPRIVEGRTLVPLRAVFEKMGYKVVYKDATRAITISNSTQNMTVVVGQRELTYNGRIADNKLDTTAQIFEGRTLIPLRIPLEILGHKVNYNDGRIDIISATKGSSYVSDSASVDTSSPSNNLNLLQVTDKTNKEAFVRHTITSGNSAIFYGANSSGLHLPSLTSTSGNPSAYMYTGMKFFADGKEILDFELGFGYDNNFNYHWVPFVNLKGTGLTGKNVKLFTKKDDELIDKYNANEFTHDGVNGDWWHVNEGTTGRRKEIYALTLGASADIPWYKAYYTQSNDGTLTVSLEFKEDRYGNCKISIIIPKISIDKEQTILRRITGSASVATKIADTSFNSNASWNNYTWLCENGKDKDINASSRDVANAQGALNIYQYKDSDLEYYCVKK